MKNRSEFYTFAITLFWVLLSCAIIICVVMLFAAQPLFLLILGNQYLGSVVIFKILLLSILIMFPGYLVTHAFDRLGSSVCFHCMSFSSVPSEYHVEFFHDTSLRDKGRGMGHCLLRPFTDTTVDIFYSETIKSIMRIGLNLLHAFPGIGGVWNYMAGLINALAEHDADNTYVAFAHDDSKKLIPRASNFVCVNSSVNPRHRISRVVYRKHAVRASWPNEYWLHALVCQCNGLFQDIQVSLRFTISCHYIGQIFFLKKRLYINTLFRRTVRKAKVLLPVSRATNNDIHRFFQRDL